MSDMDICDEPLEVKKCFKCGYQLLDNLNVAYNSSNSMIIFWNKYQLFLYENVNFEDATRIFTPEFIVHRIIISNNYLICLDRKGNVHVTSLKFKNTQKRLKTTFQPREQNIMTFVECGNYILSLKSESATYFLCLNRINSDFQGKRKIPILHKDTWLLSDTSQEKCLLTAHAVSEQDKDIRQLFDMKVIPEDLFIVILSVDRINVFACLFSPNMAQDEIQLIKFYSCPSEICNFEVIELEEVSVIVFLMSGTVVKVPLRKTSQTFPIHLNTAVSKFLILKDILIYTDGLSMWRTENTFSKISFRQFFIRDVKDFIRIGDQFICTTYSNLIYLIPDDESSYLKPDSDLYCPADKLLNNSEYLYKLLEEVEKNNELIEKLKEEGNYITALALSNRQDLMDSILKNDVVVYENYQDAIKENPDLTITEHLEEYFKPESIYILTKLKIIQMEHLVNQVLSQLFQNSKIHLTLFSEQKLLKIISLNISESLNKINLLIPLDYKLMSNISAIRVNIKIVALLPGVFDSKEPMWTTLYRKEITLNSEHFIKTELISHKGKSLKDPEETLDNLIAKKASNDHGNLFKITDSNLDAPMFSTYVKLPVNYDEIFKNRELFNHFNPTKADYLSKELSSEEFLKSKNNLTFQVGNHKVEIEIVTDEAPLLKISSSKIGKALGIRNFLANLLYRDYKMAGPELQFADYAFYTTVENLQKSIKERMESTESAELQDIVEQFQKTVGDLPV